MIQCVISRPDQSVSSLGGKGCGGQLYKVDKTPAMEKRPPTRDPVTIFHVCKYVIFFLISVPQQKRAMSQCRINVVLLS